MSILRAALVPLVLGLVLLGTNLYIVSADAAKKDSLSFSNTMTWDPAMATFRDTETHYPKEVFDTILLTPPFQNSSAATKADLEILVANKSLRTTRKIKEILDERAPAEITFGEYAIADYFNVNRFPATARLLRDSFDDITRIVLRQKQKFDRVRPSFLDSEIDPVIAVPGHPAYPSGHSTQAHFVAYVLGELMPNRKEEFIAQAEAIAKNREIAGLHYPSDSAAGVSLAQQFFAIIMQNKEFQTLLAEAKKEWR